MEHSTEPTNKTALITGATSGIGLALARLFAKDKYNLVIVARKPEELEPVKSSLEYEFKIQVTILVKDLGDAKAAQQLYDEVKRKNITVDVLVNNAGYSEYGEFYNLPLEKDLNLVQLNAISPLVLMQLFGVDMVRRGEGKILNTASLAAFQPGALLSVYHATKTFILFMTEALSDELKDSRVTVTALCPGPTKTAYHEKARMQTRLMKLTYMDASDVAKAGYEGMLAGKTIVVPGIINKLIVFGIRLGPRKLVVKITRWLQTNLSQP